RAYAKEKGQAESAYHGDGEAALFHAGETLILHEVVALEVVDVELPGEIALTKHDHPGQLLELFDRINEGDAHHEGQENLADAGDEVAGGVLVGRLEAAENRPAPEAEEGCNNGPGPAKLPAAAAPEGPTTRHGDGQDQAKVVSSRQGKGPEGIRLENGE